MTKSFPGLGFYFGNPTDAAIPQYNSFASVVGQPQNITIVFVDYRDPIYSSDQFGKQWSNNARFIAKNLARICQADKLNRLDADGNPAIVPIVSVGLVDDPTAYQLGLPTDDPNRGKYSEPAAIQFMNNVAAGKYDVGDAATGSHRVFPAILDAFRDNGFKKIYLRLGWEQNGVFYGWRVRSEAAKNAYVAAWQHVATLAKQYAIDNGMTIQTVWSPSACYANLPGAAAAQAVIVLLHGLAQLLQLAQRGGGVPGQRLVMRRVMCLVLLVDRILDELRQPGVCDAHRHLQSQIARRSWYSAPPLCHQGPIGLTGGTHFMSRSHCKRSAVAHRTTDKHA